MSKPSYELATLYERLPEAKRAAVVDFARFLLMREEEDGDEAWEAIMARGERRPRLEAFLEASAEEGSEPMDADRL